MFWLIELIHGSINSAKTGCYAASLQGGARSRRGYFDIPVAFGLTSILISALGEMKLLVL